jgi:hypothetical protein
VKAFQFLKGAGRSKPKGGNAMEQQKQLLQQLEWSAEDVEKIFSKLLGTEELDEREHALLRSTEFRRALSRRLWWWPHEILPKTSRLSKVFEFVNLPS